jgi:polygalacturonase
MHKAIISILSLKKTNVCFAVLIICLFLTAGAAAMSTKRQPAPTVGLPFVVPDIKEPNFPNNIFRITDYGAVGDGHTKNAEAFAKAITACVTAGGGRVVVPAGLWLTGPIELKSNLNLHLEQGAVILFSPDFEDYPLIRKTWEGSAAVRCTPPLHGENLENIAITGEGIIDGSGQAWRPVKKSKMTDSQWKKLLASGGVVDPAGRIWWPSKEAMNGAKTVRELNARSAELHEYAAARQYLRPVLLGLVNCKNILLDGPTFQNSPAWNLHPLLCENMIIRNVTVMNPWWGQNGDGLDIESCRNVIVNNCRFDVGDDAICMKSGKNEYGRARGRPTENIAISDCTVYHGHGGFVVGSEMSGDVRNIYVRNCSFLGTDVGIRFKSTRGRGGVVENIYIQDIRMKDIATDAVRLNMYYGLRFRIPGDEEPDTSASSAGAAVSEETPRFQDIHLRDIVCSGAAGAMRLQGLPEMPIRKISLENVTISADKGAVCIEADDVSFNNVRITAESGPVFDLYNSRNFIIENINLADCNGPCVKLAGAGTAAIHFKGVDRSALAGKIEYGKGVSADALIID